VSSRLSWSFLNEAGVMNSKVERLYVRDFGLRSSNPSDYLDLYVRCCGDSTKDLDLVFLGKCADTSKFGEGWDFTTDFRVSAEIEILSLRNSRDLQFDLINPKVEPLSDLSIFRHSKHLPIDKLLCNYAVPGAFFGNKIELNPYVRAVKRLERKNLRLVLDGFISYTQDEVKSNGQVGNTGEITVSVYLPRYDYLAGHIKNHF
jgi:hypothetical protein